MDKAHEGGPRVFRTVRIKFTWTVLTAFSERWIVDKVHVRSCVVAPVPPSGGEHRGPGQREAASGPERQLLPAGREGEERAEEEETAL